MYYTEYLAEKVHGKIAHPQGRLLVSLQGRAHAAVLRGVEEKAVFKLSCEFKEDERKRTVDEALKWVKMLSKRVVVGSTPVSL